MSLDHIQAIVERTNALKPDVVVMLGDYVDRGPQSAQVLDHLMAPPPKDWGLRSSGF